MIWRRLGRWVLLLVGLVVLSAGSVAFSLSVTPLQSVSALGQTVKVGTASPSLSLSGPGVLDLFGQSLPTQAHFFGPVRPRLVLARISVNQQVANFLQPTGHARPEAALGSRLATGWKHYFAWEIGFVALSALVLSVAYVGLRRRSWRKALLALLGAVVVAEGVNLGWVMLTAYSAPRILARVDSLSALVGQTDQAPIPAAPGPTDPRTQAVVLGDSTAAGLGNPAVDHPGALDRACGRSADAYAASLAWVNSWKVENLACSGATIPVGILGPQPVGAASAPAQLAVAKRASRLRAVFVSVGADDVSWDVMIRLCAVANNCDDAASTAYFQARLHDFTNSYYQLLRQLGALPDHPIVVVNQYYDPFEPGQHCLDHLGLDGTKQRQLIGRLAALNAVLAKGAEAFGFRSVQPDFSGHQLCTNQPYVQGMREKAPFHPTPSGELAIALADEKALGQRS